MEAAMLFLGYESAVQYWRAVRAGLIPFPPEAQITVVSNEDHLLKEVRYSAPTLPIGGQYQPDVLVSRIKFIHRSDDIRYHLCARPLPSGSFFRHTGGVAVASPELCLLHAAHSHDSGSYVGSGIRTMYADTVILFKDSLFGFCREYYMGKDLWAFSF